MSKTPAIDEEAMRDLLARKNGSNAQSSNADNPLAALVEEFGEFHDIDVSPTFKSMKGVSAVEEVGGKVTDPEVSETVPDAAHTPVESTNKPVEVDAVGPQDNDQRPDVSPTDLQQKPSKAVCRITTEKVEDKISIPTRTAGKTPEAAIIGAGSALKTSAPKRRGLRGLMVAAVALITLSGAGYLYVQSTQTASSETVVYSVPVFDDDTSATTQIGMPEIIVEKGVGETVELAEVTPPPALLPEYVPPTAPKPLGFNDSLSGDDPTLEGQSLLDLATGVPSHTPSDIVPDSEWQDVSCGGCHSFDQSDLCEQGAYYFNHDKARLNRIQHPYGGGYKAKLMEWAQGGCN